ncbi:MAG: DNA glycosylase [Eubacteriales bacterium]|nr:DNA glycosylase [Eubacteriales bacterium]
MIIIQNPDFNIQKIAESGQCFRLKPMPSGGYALVAHGRVLRLNDTPEGSALDCTEAEFDAIWRDYFDLASDYASIRAQADPEDAFLRRACDYGAGIRMLRQEPWEMLISFIISQRKNIPAIQYCIEALCSRYGEPIESGGERFYAFPSAQKLAALDEAHFLACSLGYRAKYVLAAARMVASGGLDLAAIAACSDEALYSALLAVPGVGEKVANCVMLFGYHRLARFPRDVWINRIEAGEYGGAFPTGRYPDTAGALQQYIFYYARSAEYSSQSAPKSADESRILP